MRNYIIRRLLFNIPVLFLIIAGVFMIIRIVPSQDVVELILQQVQAPMDVKQEMYRQVRSELGLDSPIYIQFGKYLWKLFQGDMGKSYYHGRPVLEELLHRLPVTIELGLIGIAIAIVVALPLGLLGAIFQDTGVDYISRILSVLFLSIPSFWTGTLIIMLPAIFWHYSPPISYQAPWQDLGQNLRQILPAAIVLGLVLMGTTARMTRSAMLEVIRQDYIRTARAKGLSERVVIIRHALKNAMIPVVTLIGLSSSVVIGGAAILEIIFALPGIGKLTVDSIGANDFPQVQANILFIAAWILITNLIVDIAYGWLDPRIRYG